MSVFGERKKNGGVKANSYKTGPVPFLNPINIEPIKYMINRTQYNP